MQAISHQGEKRKTCPGSWKSFPSPTALPPIDQSLMLFDLSAL